MNLAVLVRAFEKEGWNLSLEGFARAAAHLVFAGHAARRGGKRATARVLEFLPGRDHGLRADDTWTTHFLRLAAAIGDLPIARQELDSLGALVLDRDRVGPKIALLVRVGLIVEKRRLDGDANVAGRAFVHVQIIGSLFSRRKTRDRGALTTFKTVAPPQRRSSRSSR